MTKLHVARALVERGFQVFPVKPFAKFPPLLADWPNRAAKTVADVENLWAAMPDANAAIHCAGLVVVDVDTRSGGDVSLETLGGIYDIPVTLTTRTPSGGRHLFFRLPDGHPGVGNSGGGTPEKPGKLGPGIDIKTTGGYVVAPGSDTEAGRYHFEADVPIAEAPSWLLELLGPRTPKATTAPASPTVAVPETVVQARQWLAGQPVGGGHSYANACGLRDRGLSLDQAREVFAEHDPRQDALEQVDHAYRYATGQPGAKAVVESDLPIAQPVEKPTPPAGKGRAARSFAQMTAGRFNPPPFVVKGLLSQQSQAVVFGPPKQGKSANVTDIGLHVAAGRPWRGRKVTQGAVLYLAFEGMAGIEGRVRAWAQQHGVAGDLPFFVVAANYNLGTKEGRAALGEDVRAALGEQKPVLVVVDTVARALAKMQGDENSAADMGVLNDAIGALIAHSQACVLLIHHSGKNLSLGARGSNALLAAVDTEIEVAGGRMRVTAQRDLPPADDMAFKCLPVMLGEDEDGEAITSVVAMGAEAAPPAAKITGNARLGFEVLCRLEPDNSPVSPERWQDACKEFLGKNVRKGFYTLKSTLLDKGYVVCDDTGMVTRKLQ